MATYIKNDMQNTLINLRNKNALATASTYYEISRIILRDYFNNT